jgi:hypothetical protein
MWEIEHRADEGVATGHLGRAYSHLHWTRFGRKVPESNSLLTISAHGGALVEELEENPGGAGALTKLRSSSKLGYHA